jgi:hypothetical protein
MNIRTLIFTLFAATLLCQASSSFAMEESMKRVGEHAAQKLLEAGTKVVEKLPKNIGIQIKPADLWWPALSMMGAVSIYKGISQGLSTYWTTDQELTAKNKTRDNCYMHAASKIVAGLISLGGSWIVWSYR